MSDHAVDDPTPRVLFFDDRHYAAQGAQKLLLQLASFTRCAGAAVTVGSTKRGAFLELAESLGFRTITTGVPPELDEFEGTLMERGKLRIGLALFRQNSALFRHVRTENYDIVWAAAFRPIMSMLFATAFTRSRLVWQVMSSGYFRGFNEVASLFSSRIVLIADGLRPAVGMLRSSRLVARKVRVVKTGIEPPTEQSRTRDDLIAQLGLPEASRDGDWVVSIGAHIREKGHLDVLRAAEALPPPLRDRVALLIGGPPIDGPYRDELLAAADSAETAVYIHDWVEDVDGWLRAADIYVLASSREGLPMTLMEAMQRGVAAIGYPIGGVPELLEHEVTGMIVETGSVPGLTNALATLLTDRHLLRSISASAQRHILDEFSTIAMRRQFDLVLNELLPDLTEPGK